MKYRPKSDGNKWNDQFVAVLSRKFRQIARAKVILFGNSFLLFGHRALGLSGYEVSDKEVVKLQLSSAAIEPDSYRHSLKSRLEAKQALARNGRNAQPFSRFINSFWRR